MFGVQVAGHQDRQPAAKASVQVRSDPWAGRRKECRKDFHRSTGQHNLYDSCLQLGEARQRYQVVSYTTPDKYGLATPDCWSVCSVADIVGKPESFPGVKKCLT